MSDTARRETMCKLVGHDWVRVDDGEFVLSRSVCSFCGKTYADYAVELSALQSLEFLRSMSVNANKQVIGFDDEN